MQNCRAHPRKTGLLRTCRVLWSARDASDFIVITITVTKFKPWYKAGVGASNNKSPTLLMRHSAVHEEFKNVKNFYETFVYSNVLKTIIPLVMN